MAARKENTRRLKTGAYCERGSKASKAKSLNKQTTRTASAVCRIRTDAIRKPIQVSTTDSAAQLRVTQFCSSSIGIESVTNVTETPIKASDTVLPSRARLRRQAA